MGKLVAQKNDYSIFIEKMISALPGFGIGVLLTAIIGFAIKNFIAGLIGMNSGGYITGRAFAYKDRKSIENLYSDLEIEHFQTSFEWLPPTHLKK